jgi:hypothetical protein
MMRNNNKTSGTASLFKQIMGSVVFSHVECGKLHWYGRTGAQNVHAMYNSLLGPKQWSSPGQPRAGELFMGTVTVWYCSHVRSVS